MPDKPRIVNRLPKRIPSSERTAEIAPSTPSAEVAQTSQAITPALQELAVQAVGAVVQTPSGNSKQQEPTPEQRERDRVLQAIVEARLKERAPSVGTLGNFGGVQVANQIRTREEATVTPDLTIQDLGVHFMAVLRNIYTDEFQENLDRVAATRNLDRGELATKVNNLAAIMAVPPPELLEATDFADSTLLVKMTKYEEETVNKYASFQIAKQGYSLGLLAADPKAYAAFKALLPPEEQLALQVTVGDQERWGMWRAPARTPDSVAKLVQAAPIHAPVDYLEAVHAVVDEVMGKNNGEKDKTKAVEVENQKNIVWKDETESGLRRAADKAVSKVVDMMGANAYKFLSELKKNNIKVMDEPPKLIRTVKDLKQPPKKRPWWLGKEREAPLDPVSERIRHLTFAKKALDVLKERGSMEDKVKGYLYHDAFDGHKVVWDEASNKLVSQGRVPDVEKIDEKRAAQVFREVVIPLACANGAGSKKEELAAQLHVGLSEKLRVMIEAHQEENPKVQARHVERTIGTLLGGSERSGDKQQRALNAFKSGQAMLDLTEAIDKDPELRARRGLDPQAPEIERRSPPNILER